MTLSFSPLAAGEEQPVSQTPQTAEEQQTDLLSPIDAPRNYLAEKLVSFARETDRFFGGDRNFQETNQTVVQLSVAKAMGQLGDYKNVFSGRAKLDLPATQKRLHLLLETDPDKNVTGTDTQGQAAATGPAATTTTTASGAASGTTTPESYSAALRYEKQREEERPKHLSADAGLKVEGFAPRPFARMRGSYSVPLEQWRLKAAQSVFWFNTTGTGETTQLDVERFISAPTLFRASSSATWLVRTHNFDLRQDFTFYQTVSERNALLYQAAIVGVTRPAAQVSDSVLLLQYRHQFRRKWIFFELSPQLHFPKDKGYHLKTLLTMRLLFNLDESR